MAQHLTNLGAIPNTLCQTLFLINPQVLIKNFFNPSLDQSHPTTFFFFLVFSKKDIIVILYCFNYLLEKKWTKILNLNFL